MSPEAAGWHRGWHLPVGAVAGVAALAGAAWWWSLATTREDPVCSSAHFTASIELDHTSYPAGATNRVSATFTNSAGRTCSLWSLSTFVRIVDGDGQTVAHLTSVVSDAVRPEPIEPGAVLSHEDRWPGEWCRPECGSLPPGPYTVVVHMAPLGEVSAGFEVLAPAPEATSLADSPATTATG